MKFRGEIFFISYLIRVDAKVTLALLEAARSRFDPAAKDTLRKLSLQVANSSAVLRTPRVSDFIRCSVLIGWHANPPRARACLIGSLGTFNMCLPERTCEVHCLRQSFSLVL